jgi:nucleoid-associated protein YgaU
MAENKNEFPHKSLDDDLKYRPAKYIAEHTVSGDETLSHIALKYYGSAVKEKWMLIYNANKAVIGDDPNRIRPGQVLKIPEQPKE